jgi:hypothetical protein
MPIAARHRDDVTTPVAPLPGLVVHRESDAAAMAALQGRPVDAMAERFAAGHRAYVARLDGANAAWGWVATRTADIGELGTTFALPAGERYLWNFVTLPSHRGRGIYPRLIDEIVRAESREAERFWIAYAPENRASGSGIVKAGFFSVAELSFDTQGRPAVKELVPGGGRVAERLLGLPEASEGLAPCWRCVRAGRGVMSCPPGACACDYQQPHSGCAA